MSPFALFSLFLLVPILCIAAVIYIFVSNQREVGKIAEANASLVGQLSQMSAKMRHMADHNVAMLKRVSESRRELFGGKGEMKFDPKTDLVSVDDLHEETEASDFYPTTSFPAEPVEFWYTGSTKATSAQLYDARTQARIWQDLVAELTHSIAARLVEQDMVAFHVILDPSDSMSMAAMGGSVKIPQVTVMARFYGHRIGRPLHEVFGDAFPPPLPAPGELIVKPSRPEDVE